MAGRRMPAVTTAPEPDHGGAGTVMDASAWRNGDVEPDRGAPLMNKSNAFATVVFLVIFGAGVAVAYLTYGAVIGRPSVAIGAGAALLAAFVAVSIKIADQWEKVVVLRLGEFRALKGPGLFFIIPIVDAIPYWIDTRVITATFKAEKTLTKDTVPVDVDAVLFWKVVDPKRAALDVADYRSAISWASQTALRDVIGKTLLSDMLEGRDKISTDLQKIIDQRTEPWGINVISVEVKDVLIPPALEDAMSMQAQAERERQARVILGDSERQVAEKFGEAAKTYINNPVALHLRAMNMLYEGLKTNATIVVVPSTALESMQLGGLAGLTALTMGLGQEQAKTQHQPEIIRQADRLNGEPANP
jgi:regulator of protease activity HflC (stomatin/prohibitin superfamily)